MEVHFTPFYLFGMGARRKLVYKSGVLSDALNESELRKWDVKSQKIVPSEYSVFIVCGNGQEVVVFENEGGVYIQENGAAEAVTESPVCLPRFEGTGCAAEMRALHQEILIHIIDGKPVPNFFVYKKPWYRDAAMMCMCLQKTNNTHLVREWIMGLADPFDRNNAGIAEPDNLGQALFLISLVADQSHPLVPIILQSAKQYEKEGHIIGLSDFAEHPVYQTKWLKFGLASLGLKDNYAIPEVYDSYSSLFWMAYRNQHVGGPGFDARTNDLYPYLAWAEAHFHQAPFPSMPDVSRYPLTWEAEASQADYSGIGGVCEEYERRKVAAPHTWHAAEAFLYLLE